MSSDQSMPNVSDRTSFDFTALSARERYKLMIGTIIPRPIALVTTVDENGRFNAAPFSFFNCLSADPPIRRSSPSAWRTTRTCRSRIPATTSA